MKTHSREEINTIAAEAGTAFLSYRHTTAAVRAAFLRSIGSLIEDHRESLRTIASEETALTHARLDPEITRTIYQCKLFADLLEEGSWVRAIIDTALPDRKPLPRPDLRQMQTAIGPVAVFGASNFPFAYSVCGGDTVAALAAGCPVVYKVNPGHPRTSEAVGALVQRAADQHQLHKGVFGIVSGTGTEPGTTLVMHPAIKAVGFTGSLQGGRAIYNAAATREEPIPVYAEMGSTNPVFILPRLLDQKSEELASWLAQSNTLSAGQFCTNPGIMIKQESAGAATFDKLFSQNIINTPPAPMLNEGILQHFNRAVDTMKSNDRVNLIATSKHDEPGKTAAYVFHTTASSFIEDRKLHEEMFGPASVQVSAGSKEELLAIAQVMPGQITASVWGTEEDLNEYRELIDFLQLKAGRVIINSVPTGVEVSPAMNHGGPYPATTDSKFTSVGTQSIYRFTRPVCFQNYPQFLLPEELKNENARKIQRLVNGMPSTANL